MKQTIPINTVGGGYHGRYTPTMRKPVGMTSTRQVLYLTLQYLKSKRKNRNLYKWLRYTTQSRTR